jgi:hypothetical protein
MEVARIIHDLMLELSTEIDMAYENRDLFAMDETRKVLDRAADALSDAGIEPPAAYFHIAGRFATMAGHRVH